MARLRRAVVAGAVAAGMLAAPASAGETRIPVRTWETYEACASNGAPNRGPVRPAGESYSFATLCVLGRHEWVGGVEVQQGPDRARRTRTRCVWTADRSTRCRELERVESDVETGTIARSASTYTVKGKGLVGCDADFAVAAPGRPTAPPREPAGGPSVDAYSTTATATRTTRPFTGSACGGTIAGATGVGRSEARTGADGVAVVTP